MATLRETCREGGVDAMPSPGASTRGRVATGEGDGDALLPPPVKLQDINPEESPPRGQGRSYHLLEVEAGGRAARSPASPGGRHGGWTVLGASLLFAGSAVGGGMLAVPAATLASGFVPAVMALTVAWLYLVCHGLVLVVRPRWSRPKVVNSPARELPEISMPFSGPIEHVLRQFVACLLLWG